MTNSLSNEAVFPHLVVTDPVIRWYTNYERIAMGISQTVTVSYIQEIYVQLENQIEMLVTTDTVLKRYVMSLEERIDTLEFHLRHTKGSPTYEGE